jgi:hypothetical protein
VVEWAWLGTRDRGWRQTTGLRLTLTHRAGQVEYMGVTPHQFRGTFSDNLGSGYLYADDVVGKRVLEVRAPPG